jgi:hypothetical protein
MIINDSMSLQGVANIVSAHNDIAELMDIEQLDTILGDSSVKLDPITRDRLQQILIRRQEPPEKCARQVIVVKKKTKSGITPVIIQRQ